MSTLARPIDCDETLLIFSLNSPESIESTAKHLFNMMQVEAEMDDDRIPCHYAFTRNNIDGDEVAIGLIYADIVEGYEES